MQRLGLDDSTVCIHIIAVGHDGLADVGILHHVALDILVAVLVNDDVDGVAVFVEGGTGVGDDGLVAVDLHLGLDGRDNLVPQDDMVVALVLRRGAHELDVDIAAGDRRVDAQRMVGAVDELIIKIAPVDRRIHTELDIGNGKHMRRALCDLEIGVEAGGIDRGRDLTDASAGLCLALAAGLVDDSGLIALLRRALTNDFVERELVAGVQDCAVDGLAGQLQILRAACLRGMRAVAGTEYIGEVFLLQFGQRDLRLDFLGLNDDLRAGIGHGKLLRVIRHVEAEADLFRNQLLLFLVVVRVLHLGRKLVVILLQIDRRAGLGIVVKFQLGQVACVEPGDDRVIECIGVERNFRRARHDRDSLGIGVDRNGRVDLFRRAGARGLVDQIADIRGIKIRPGFERNVLPGLLRAFVCEKRRDRAAVAAIIHGGIRRLVRVEGDVGDLRGEVDRPVWQDDGERIGGRLLFDGKRHSVDRGVALQSADVHAGDIDVRENGVASL